MNPKKVVVLTSIISALILFVIIWAFINYDTKYESVSVEGLSVCNNVDQIRDTNFDIKHRSDKISSKDGLFIDDMGRTCFLRGVNLSGSSKLPYYPNMTTKVKDCFFEIDSLSYVGRPFPLNEMETHLDRLRSWGFNYCRLLVPWEALEHKAPGKYDDKYIDYLIKIIKCARKYGIYILIDAHQDCWSRFSGGDGAPAWTFDIANLDIKKFDKTGAAIVENTAQNYPQMVWFSNYYKLATSTMFTLFYGGKDFAPHLKIDNENVQEYLQRHYIDAYTYLMSRVGGLSNVIGIEPMNEPSSGYIGIENLDSQYSTDIVGAASTPWEAMLLGEGKTLSVPHFHVGSYSVVKDDDVVLNKENLCVWKNKNSVWKNEGIYRENREGDLDLVKANYFSFVKGRKVDFNTDYYIPFLVRFASSISKVCSDKHVCVGNVLFPYPLDLPNLNSHSDIRWINGFHWYDDATLATQKYRSWLGYMEGDILLGKHHVRTTYSDYMKRMKSLGEKRLNKAPTVLGEFGLPFNLDNKRAYKNSDYSMHVEAFNNYFRIVEQNQLNYCIWNYTPDNNHVDGDLWNGEDLSIFSKDDSIYSGINKGGRALDALVRPFPLAIAGDVVSYRYDPNEKVFCIEWVPTVKNSSHWSEIFIPSYVYGNNFKIYSNAKSIKWNPNIRKLFINDQGIDNHIILVVKS